MPDREEFLVSAVPLKLRIERGPGQGELQLVAEGFDPIELAPSQRIVIRPEGQGVVIERESLKPA